MRIGVVGGTGREGHGLSQRWALAGHEVFVGSRDPERARVKASELSRDTGKALTGGSNEEAAQFGEVVVLCVPYTAHAATLESLRAALQGRVLVDITVPLQPPKVRVVHVPAGGSAAAEGQALLGDQVKVVAALHHVSSAHLGEPGHGIECDVLVCSNDAAALERVIGLIKDLGLRAYDAGPLANAVALESLTPVLLHLNKRYKAEGAGIRFTGLPE